MIALLEKKILVVFTESLKSRETELLFLPQKTMLMSAHYAGKIMIVKSMNINSTISY